MVLEAGLEPARPREREILSLLCLPIPPYQHRFCEVFRFFVNFLLVYFCQKFSDPRGNVFFEIGKTIDAKRPFIVFLENVANLTEHDHGRTFNVIHNELAGRDYFLRYLVADACEYADIPQHRTRTYLMAFRDEEKCRRFAFPDKKPLTIRITDVIDTTQKAEESFYLHPGDYGYDKMVAAIRDDKQLYRFSDYGIQSSKDGIAFTLKANMGTYPNRIPVIKDKFGIRRITPMECLALQGFPPNFTFPSTVPLREQYKQAGNTVCANFVFDFNISIDT